MRLLLVLATASLASAAKLDNTYLPPNAQTSGGSGNFLQTPLSGVTPGFNGPASRLTQNAYTYNNGFPQNDNYAQSINYGQIGQNFVRPERPRAALERNAAILRQYNQNNGDNFEYAYETENGIYAEERGVASNNGVESQGGYTYTADDGQVYSVRYTAGENGFVPEGDHLPTSPPVPEEILKALEQNARDEAAGIYDDGSYNEAKYGDNTNQYANNNNGNNYNGNSYNGNSYNGNSYNGNANGYNGNDDSIVTNSALFDTGVSGFRNVNGVGASNGLKTYLPPVRGAALGSNGFGRKPSFNARDGYQY